MFIKFGWGANAGPKELTYVVTNYSLSIDTQGDTTKLANCVPGEICLSIEIPDTVKNPAAEFLSFALNQHSTAKKQGEGKIAVYKGEDVEESIQEISFKKGWITDLDLGSSVHDSKSVINLRFAAAEVTVSGVNFMHRARGDHFAK